MSDKKPTRTYPTPQEAAEAAFGPRRREPRPPDPFLDQPYPANKTDLQSACESLRKRLIGDYEESMIALTSATAIVNRLWDTMRRIGGTVPSKPKLREIHPTDYLKGDPDGVIETLAAAVDAVIQWCESGDTKSQANHAGGANAPKRTDKPEHWSAASIEQFNADPRSVSTEDLDRVAEWLSDQLSVSNLKILDEMRLAPLLARIQSETRRRPKIGDKEPKEAAMPEIVELTSTAPPENASNEEESITDRQRMILETMLTEGIISERRRESRAKIVKKINRTHKPAAYNRDFATLGKRHYLRVLKGPRGGMWINPPRKTEIEQILKDNPLP